MVTREELNAILVKAKELGHELTEREHEVISMRFGVDNGKPMTLEEVGKVYNVTRERIRQIEAKALRKLRSAMVTQ